MIESKFLSVRETARETGISETFIRKCLAKNKVPGFNSGRKFMVDVPAFLSQLENHETSKDVIQDDVPVVDVISTVVSPADVAEKPIKKNNEIPKRDIKTILQEIIREELREIVREELRNIIIESIR